MLSRKNIKIIKNNKISQKAKPIQNGFQNEETHIVNLMKKKKKTAVIWKEPVTNRIHARIYNEEKQQNLYLFCGVQVTFKYLLVECKGAEESERKKNLPINLYLFPDETLNVCLKKQLNEIGLYNLL